MTWTFFTDRDLGKQFPQILRDAGLTVERHMDHFAHDAPDAEWLEIVGKRIEQHPRNCAPKVFRPAASNLGIRRRAESRSPASVIRL